MSQDKLISRHRHGRDRHGRHRHGRPDGWDQGWLLLKIAWI